MNRKIIAAAVPMAAAIVLCLGGCSTAESSKSSASDTTARKSSESSTAAPETPAPPEASQSDWPTTSIYTQETDGFNKLCEGLGIDKQVLALIPHPHLTIPEEGALGVGDSPTVCAYRPASSTADLTENYVTIDVRHPYPASPGSPGVAQGFRNSVSLGSAKVLKNSLGLGDDSVFVVDSSSNRIVDTAVAESSELHVSVLFASSDDQSLNVGGSAAHQAAILEIINHVFTTPSAYAPFIADGQNAF